MKKFIIFNVLFTYIFCIPFFLSPSFAKGVKTSYKRYSIFKYKNEEILCEPYIVNKDDWLYKIFRKKGEISEKDFPHFIIIFKEINPDISNIDAIDPGIHVMIPLKKVKQEDYDQSSPGNVDIPVVEFSAVQDDVNLKPFIHTHKIKKGETVSNLIDKDFLIKGGQLSREGLKAFQLANPNIKNINIIYEGADIYLPDPSIKSKPWFKSLLSGKPVQNEIKRKKLETEQYRLAEYKLAQLKKYSSLIGGTLLSQGKMYFPGKNNSNQVLDLSSTPLIETRDGSKILIISGENINEELLQYAHTYWKDLRTQLISETINKTGKNAGKANKKNITTEYKKLIKTLLFQTDYEYIPDARIPFTINKISLEASFGRIIREDTTDLLINFGNVYGSALEVLKKREFEIISITSKLTTLEVLDKLFTHIGYTTWKNPSFSTGERVENIQGLYAVKDQNKLFIPLASLKTSAADYLKKENIKILSTRNRIDRDETKIQ